MGGDGLQEPLAPNKRVWILHKRRDGCVVALGRTGGHYKTSSGVNKNGKLRRVCEFPQQLVEVLQLVLHGEEAMYPEVDGKLKWDTDLLQYASDNDD
jgi:hypothetical protein